MNFKQLANQVFDNNSYFMYMTIQYRIRTNRRFFPDDTYTLYVYSYYDIVDHHVNVYKRKISEIYDDLLHYNKIYPTAIIDDIHVMIPKNSKLTLNNCSYDYFESDYALYFIEQFLVFRPYYYKKMVTFDESDCHPKNQITSSMTH